MLRKFATGAALSAALLLPLAACSSTDKSSDGGEKKAAAAPSPSPKPTEQLAAAVTKTKGVNVKYKLGDTADQMTGSYDATKKSASMDGESEGQKLQLVVT